MAYLNHCERGVGDVADFAGGKRSDDGADDVFNADVG